jgi:hypothetical protein
VTLTITVDGSGSGVVKSSVAISCPPDCTETVESGTSVQLYVFPSAGSAFTGWTGGGCSGDDLCTTTISSDTTVTATIDEACVRDPGIGELSIKAGYSYVQDPEGNFYPHEVKILSVEQGLLVYEGKPCADATTVNTDAIRVFGEIPAYLILDLGDTGLAPGATAEPIGASEIELYLDVQHSFGDAGVFVSLSTTDAPETIALGQLGWNLNGDDDVDVFPGGISSVEASSEGGADLITAQGGFGTGEPTTLRLGLGGGDGSDRLVGNDLQNYLVGGNGPDTIIARRGNDWVWGTKGADVLRGGGDKDRLFGGNGADQMNGGQGVDECRGERGQDTSRSCERLADRNL